MRKGNTFTRELHSPFLSGAKKGLIAAGRRMERISDGCHKRLRPSQAFIWLSLLGMAGIFIILLAGHGQRIQDYFFYNVTDTGMDFFHSIEYLHGNQPYQLFETLYPPLANLFFALIYRFMPPYATGKWTWSFRDSLKMRGTENDLRIYQAPMLAFIVFIILRVLLIAGLTAWAVRNKPARTRYGIVFSVVCSFSMLFAFERGNILLLSWAMTLYYLLTYDHHRPFVRETGLIALAAAAALKLYPAVFGLLLLREKRYRQVIRAVIYGILLTLLPCLCFDEGFRGLGIWLNVLLYKSNIPGKAAMDYSLKANVRFLFQVLEGAYQIHVGKPAILILSYLPAAAVLFSAFIVKEKWKALCAAAAAFLLIQPQSVYGMAFFLLPLLLVFREQDAFPRGSRLRIWVMILMNIHGPYLFARVEYYLVLMNLLTMTCVWDVIKWVYRRKTEKIEQEKVGAV